METVGHGNLLVNLDKKKIMEPKKLTWSGGSGLIDISLIHPEFGNPFQYELFHLLMDEWKGDRITMVRDSPESRDYLTNEEDYSYYRTYKHTLRRQIGRVDISYSTSEMIRWKEYWDKFINQFVLINYDSHLFMTIDRRLLRRTKSLMPYFALAQGEERSESKGSWAGDRIGIEPIGTSTFDSLDYFEMFRMVGDKSACQLGKEEYERRYGS